MTDVELRRRAVALGRRAVACKHWRWMPGMLVRYSDGEPWYRLTEADSVYGIRPPKYRPPDWRYSTPVLTDPATLGCLLALVREAWSDPGVSVWYDRRVGLWSWMAEGCLHSVHRPSDEDGYDTEAAALVAALEAAK